MQNNNISILIESLKNLKNDSSLNEYEDTKTLELLILQMKVLYFTNYTGKMAS